MPRIKDKKNQRFGIVKTTCEFEAGVIILIAKEKGETRSRIKILVNSKGTSKKSEEGKACKVAIDGKKVGNSNVHEECKKDQIKQ